MLLFFFEPFGVLLLPLTRVEPEDDSMSAMIDHEDGFESSLRCLPVPQQPFLLLEFFDFVFIVCLIDQHVNRP